MDQADKDDFDPFALGGYGHEHLCKPLPKQLTFVQILERMLEEKFEETKNDPI